jgi:hypothetical protein
LGARREQYEQNRRPRPDPYATPSGGPSMIGNFIIVSGVVAVATVAASLILEFFRASPAMHSSPAPRRREARPDG